MPNLGPSNYQSSEQKSSSSSETFGSNTMASLFNRFVKPEIAPQSSLTSQSDQRNMNALIGSLNAENGTPASNSNESLTASSNISNSSVTSSVSTSSSVSSVAVSSVRASSSAKQQKQSNSKASAPLTGLGLTPIVPDFVNWPMRTPVSGYVNQASPNYGAGYQPEAENRNVSPLAPSNYQPRGYYQGNEAGANEPTYTPANDYGLVRSGRHVRPVNVAHGRYLHRGASYRGRVPYFIVLKRGVRLYSASNFKHGYVKAVIRAHSATLRVAGVMKYHGRTRYLVYYRGYTGYVTTNRAYVRDAYYAPRRHRVRAIIIRNCWLHHGKHFSYRDRHAIKHLKRGTLINADRIVRYYHRSRLYIKGYGFVTGDKDFVKLVK